MFSLFRVPLSRKPASSICSLHSILLSSVKIGHHHQYHYNINVSSTETIKPSSPTPSNLTSFKLSLIDNQVSPIYVPFVFFYPAAGQPADRLEVLKSSLAKALTRFYPLAGRLSKSATDESSIPIVHCNDEGVPFSSATVDDYSSMAQFLGDQPRVDSLHQFLPFPADMISTAAGLESAPQIGFRATAFPCGGLVIGVCMFHKIMDGATLGEFMKLWSAVARSNGEMEEEAAYAHNRAATSFLPARHEDVAVIGTDSFAKPEEEKIVTRRFVFDEEAVNSLKAKAKSERVPKPSRTEAVAGFCWKWAVSATIKALSPDGAMAGSVRSVAAMAVNLRPRFNEPWPDYSIGNIYWPAVSFYHHKQQHHSSDETKTLQEFVAELRSSTAKMDKEFMTKLQGEDGRQEFLRNQEIIWKAAFPTENVGTNGSRVIPFTISSLIGLRLYDIDFGWGKPIWVSMTTHTYAIKNMVALMESSTRYGVDAWLTLDQQKMAILEQEVGFLTYAKNNTPVIQKD